MPGAWGKIGPRGGLCHMVEGLTLSPRPSASGLVSWGFSQIALQRLPRPRKRAPGGSQEQGSKEEPLPRTVGARSPGRGQGPRPPRLHPKLSYSQGPGDT